MSQNLAGLKIRALRRKSGLTQGELARRAGISPSYLNLIELNKRAVGGALVDRIAAGLVVDRSELDGEAERRVVANLDEIAADPEIASPAGHPGSAAELVGRNPEWADLVLRLHRAWLDKSEAVLALADRLNRDPFLGDSVHRMLTNAASIRAAAEILVDDNGLAPVDRRRFLSIVAGDAHKLSAAATSLLDFFDSAHMRVRSATPAEHVDAFVLAIDNYFPVLEELAEGFLESRLPGETPETAAERLLRARGRHRPEPPFAQTAEARRFGLLREALRDDAREATRELVETHPALVSEESRALAASALDAYAAAAVLMPYEAFLEAAGRHRYDLDALSRLFGVSYEQAAHRLATLRRPGAEGVRFAFMRSDASGYVTKRLPLPRLPLPRYGNACPLWAIHAAFQMPGVTARGFGELPSGEQFLFFARAVEKRPPSAALPRHLMSVMLVCAAAEAGRVVYGDGIDRTTATVPVGTICRLCPRTGCGHRQEAPLIA
ncbi:helix-turn-helix domain-containing protein [Mesorhizobium sp. ZC-5]|uniref:helix-turn-helix domain-containing protein n=1 Tax=Mesorhizobium sp. ZC-5 TaxID=2986066 RepID=UPI0021E89A17|nr:helix-turn-helix transcriptional regulator [Mesorhizobium sp. ZC-5]MCV3239637.1 short-chain fatty acyl-CoA regulator family protein [Mesorhizobium sp. ZC-5]